MYSWHVMTVLNRTRGVPREPPAHPRRSPARQPQTERRPCMQTIPILHFSCFFHSYAENRAFSVSFTHLFSKGRGNLHPRFALLPTVCFGGCLTAQRARSSWRRFFIPSQRAPDPWREVRALALRGGLLALHTCFATLHCSATVSRRKPICLAHKLLLRCFPHSALFASQAPLIIKHHIFIAWQGARRRDIYFSFSSPSYTRSNPLSFAGIVH